MFRIRLFLAISLQMATLAAAQEPTALRSVIVAHEPKLTLPEMNLTKISAGVRASYYHPDDLSGMNCGVVIDWADLVSQLHVADAPARLKPLEGMTIEVHAERGKAAQIETAWPGGKPPQGGDALESSAKQMLAGFFKMYWPMAAASMGPGPKDTFTADEKDGGGYLLHVHSGTSGEHSGETEEISREYLVTKIFSDNGAVNSTIEPHFTASQKPTADDPRRLTALDVSNRTGTNVMNVHVGMDYQTVGGFHIPQHLSLGVGGVYEISMELIGCSVSKTPTLAPEVK